MMIESFVCDVLTYAPYTLSKWIARAAFWPSLVWTMIKDKLFPRANAWWSHIDDNVILGALPIGRAQQLKELGVGLVINACEEWDGNREIYRQLGIQQVIVETIDYTAPILAHAEAVVRAMNEFLAANPQGKIFVHCKAGRGRSATLLLCYYIQKGMTPLQAQALLNAKRPQVASRSWKRKVVKDYVKVHVLGWSLNDDKVKEN